MDTDAAEVAEKLERRACGRPRRSATRVRARHAAVGQPWRRPVLQPPSVFPLRGRSRGRIGSRSRLRSLFTLPPSRDRTADSLAREAAPSAIVAPGELPVDLQPLGQVQESFIVATNATGLWIVDQHAAHERVLFERHLRLRREKKVEVQRLLLPIFVELRAEQQVTFQEIAEELAANGFEVEPFGQRTVAIKAAPAETRADDVERTDAGNPGQRRAGRARTLSLDLLRKKIAASVSCHAAIKVNMSLDRNKMDWLLRALGETDCPMTCPHGRPIVLRYGMKDLAEGVQTDLVISVQSSVVRESPRQQARGVRVCRAA